MDHFTVSLGVALGVVDIPAQGIKERIDKVAAGEGFVVFARGV